MFDLFISYRLFDWVSQKASSTFQFISTAKFNTIQFNSTIRSSLSACCVAGPRRTDLNRRFESRSRSDPRVQLYGRVEK